MKCYTIQSNDEFIADVPRPITDGFYQGNIIQTADMVEEAKHYRQRSQAKSWIKKNTERAQENYDRYLESYREAKQRHSNNKWWGKGDSYKRRYETSKVLLSWLADAQIIELDLEKPNFERKLKIVWDRWRKSSGQAGKGLCKLTQVTTGRHYCKCCGLQLKNIPYYDFFEGNGYKVCIPCLYIRMDSIKAAFEGMPEDFRESVVNELVLGSM